MLRLWGLSELEDVTALLASELVTNSVLHASTPMRLRLQLEPPSLRVAVEDGAPQLPQSLPLSPSSDRGRGLWMIERLSRRWGATPSSAGKTVGFELEIEATGDGREERSPREGALS